MIQIAGTLLVTKDGLIVLNRRSDDAPTSPGLLGLFGGHVEPGEDMLTAAKRELTEETSLNVEKLKLEFVSDFAKGEKEYGLFKAVIDSPDFEVFEGVGLEVYKIEDALERDDLTNSARFLAIKVQGK